MFLNATKTDARPAESAYGMWNIMEVPGRSTVQIAALSSMPPGSGNEKGNDIGAHTAG